MIRRTRPGALLAGLVAAAVLLLTGCAGGAGGAELGTAAFADRVAETGTVVLDVRTPAEFASGHLAGAVNIDVEAPDFDQRIAGLDRGVRYAVYCRSGNRSAVALDRMTEAGFTDLAHLGGGISAWAAAGRPVTTD